MTNFLTIDVLSQIKTDFATAEETRDYDALGEALSRISRFAGTGEPTDSAAAVRIGPDYICALDDGRIVAWGPEYVAWPGQTGREINVL